MADFLNLVLLFPFAYDSFHEFNGVRQIDFWFFYFLQQPDIRSHRTVVLAGVNQEDGQQHHEVEQTHDKGHQEDPVRKYLVAYLPRQ